MSYTVLARRWRPGRFGDLVGQEHVVQALVNGLEQNRLHHAFLFTGTRGVGKTTIARILAKSLNCETGVSAEPCGECSTCVDIDQGRFVDLLEVDAASRTKVDDTREILDNVQYAPSRGRYKVYLIDEVHMLSLSSFNALLKTLEEPPDHVKFVLATTDPHKIPVTILSRCLRFNLRRLRPEEINAYLQRMLDEERLSWDAEGLALIARAADGSMRDGLSLLDQAIAYGGGALKGDDTQRMLGMVEQRHLERILSALQQRDCAAMMAVSSELWDMGLPPERVLGDLARVWHRIAILQQLPDYEDPADLSDQAARAWYQQFDPETVQLYYQIALHGLRDLDLAPDARMALEMTLLRLAAFSPDDTAGTDNTAPPAATRSTAAGVETTAGAQASNQRASGTAAAPPSAELPNVSSTGTSKAPKTSGAALTAMPQPLPATADIAAAAATPPVAPPARQSGEVLPAPAAAAPPHIAEARPEYAGNSSDAAPVIAPPAPAVIDQPQPVIDENIPWQQLLKVLPLSSMTREFAANLHLEQRTREQWRFVLPAHLSYLNTKRQEQALSQALSQVLGRELKLRISTREGNFDTPAVAAAAERDAAAQAAVDAAQQDPVMQRLQERFDARIIPGSIHPLDG